MFEMRRKSLNILYTILFILLTFSVIYNFSQLAADIGEDEELDTFLIMALNLYKNSTISLEKTDRPNPLPTSFWEPAYPVYLYFCMALNPIIGRNVGFDKLRKDRNLITFLKYLQIPILITISLCTAYIVRITTGNILLAFVGLIMTGFSPSLMRSLISFYSEAFAALILLCVAICLYKVFEKKKIIYYFLLGFALGCLVLTRAQFIYCIVFILCLLFYGAYKKVFENKKRFFIGLTTLVAIYSLIVGGWIMRNYIHFKLLKISERGPIVLLTRSEKNLMNIKEFFGSFFYWTWDGLLFCYSTHDNYSKEKGVIGFINKKRAEIKDFLNLSELIKEGAVFERLNRNNNSSFTSAAWNKYSKIEQKYAESSNSKYLIEKETEELAKDQIFAHPIRHILATLPFAWRGIFFEVAVRSKYFPPFELLSIMLMIISVIYFPALFFITFVSLKDKIWPLLAFSLPALYLFAVNSFLTHNLPRYNIPLMPILAASLLISFRMITEKKLKQKP